MEVSYGVTPRHGEAGAQGQSWNVTLTMHWVENRLGEGVSNNQPDNTAIHGQAGAPMSATEPDVMPNHAALTSSEPKKAEDDGGEERVFSDQRTVRRDDDALQMDYTTWEVTRRIWAEHLRPRMRLIMIASIAMAVSALTTGVIPFLIQRAVDDVFIAKNSAMILTITLAVVGVTLVKTVSEYFGNVSVNYLGHRFIADMRIHMIERLAYADLSWIERTHSGRLLAGFLNDANMIRQTASRVIVALGENLVKVIVLAAAMFWMDWRLALLIMTCLPAGILLMNRQRRKMRKSTKKSLQETGDLSALITQTLRGIRIVRAYGREQHEVSRARANINRALEFTMRGARAQALSSPAVELLAGIGFALAIYYAGTKGITGEMSEGHFMGFMAATMLIYQPLKAIATLQTVLQEGVAAASRVFGIIDQQPHLEELPDALPLAVTKGEIVFENVTFGYDDDKPVLKNFSMTVHAGQTVALVGPSGAGKSTILNLVLRFYDPQQGAVLIDGQNISDVTVASLREATALVTQEPILFDETLGANIAYGVDGASNEDIAAAAKAAAAHDFIMATPKGYNNPVGEAGNALSGGERQRVAIARAILKNAPILLLDEPTSALDSQAEAKVQTALEKLMRGRTVLMIAHRLSTVKKADLICVVNEGRIVETGRHSELIALNGLYAKLHKTQLEANGEDRVLDESDKTADDPGRATDDAHQDQSTDDKNAVLAGE